MKKFVTTVFLVLLTAVTACADGVKISAMSAAGPLGAYDEFPVVQGGATKAASVGQIFQYILAVDGMGSGLDADKLQGQTASYFQPASTAITTSNIGSQHVQNSDQLGGNAASYYQPLSTAINQANIGSQSVNYASTAGNSTNLGGHPASYYQPAGAVSAQVIPITATESVSSWTTTINVTGTTTNLMTGSFNVIQGANAALGWKVTVDSTVLYDGSHVVNYQVGFSPTFMANLTAGSHTVTIQLYGSGTYFWNPTGSGNSGFINVISF